MLIKVVAKIRIEYALKSFYYTGAMIYNDLPLKSEGLQMLLIMKNVSKTILVKLNILYSSRNHCR